MEESVKNFCHGLSLTDFTKVGCGTCTATCNEYATDAEKLLVGNDIGPDLGTDFTVAGCLQRCRDDPLCKGISIDQSGATPSCSLHNTLPYLHGALCDGQCHNEDTCSNSAQQACLAKTTSTSTAQMVELGTGRCDRHSGTLTVLSNEAWPMSSSTTVLDNCEASCLNSTSCKAFNLGTRRCVGTAGGDSEPAELDTATQLTGAILPVPAVAKGPETMAITSDMKEEGADRKSVV